jgi:hypothetical protein
VRNKLLLLALVLVTSAVGSAIGSGVTWSIMSSSYDPPGYTSASAPVDWPQTVPSIDGIPQDLPADPCRDGRSEKIEKDSPFVLKQSTTEDIFVGVANARVTLVGDATTTGFLTVCGADATLVMDKPHMDLKAWISGGGARVVIVDPVPGVEYFNPDKVSLTGGEAEAVGCGVKRTDITPCTAYLN